MDTPLEWPLESSGAEAPAARIIDVTPDVSGWSIILPDATLTGAGQTILFNNIDSTYSFYVKDHAGNTLATVTAGTQWQVYLAATTTVAGTWRVFRYGASTATVQPSALAGFGLSVTGSTLSQSLPVLTFSATGTTVATSNRASAFVWNATGSGTLNLLTAASAGNNFFVFVRNEGGGDLTIDPSGSETINSAATLVLRPGDSATIITDGVSWYTIGLGQEAVFAFDFTSISVTGGTVTLSGSQLNRIAYKFVGTLTSNCIIVVPPTVQQYWINNATTGAFTLSVKTSSGTPTVVNPGAKGIYYCDGTNMVLASDPTTLSTPIVVSDGGTGATTASGARLSLGITLFADPIVTATTGASVRTTIGAAASGANGDITSLTGLTTALSAPQGGTGQSVYAVGDLLYASTTTALSKLADVATGNALISGGVSGAPAWGKIGLTTHVTGTLAVANGGTGAATLTGYVKGTGTTAMTASATIPSTDITGTLAVANGGTGQSTYTNGQLLIGNTTGGTLAKATLTAGTNVSITNGAGTITINATDAFVGTVTSVGGTGTVNGITLTGTVTTTGNLTLGGTLSGVSLTTQVSGTLPVANGGTGATTAGAALTSLGAYAATNPSGFTSNTGTVTSVATSGTVNGITLTGSVTSTGTLTLGGTLSGVSLTTQVSGTLPVANGGTGATTAGAALTSLGAYAASNPSGFTSNTGTVTSVATSGTVNGITLTGSVTSTGTLTLGGTLSGVSLTTQVSGTLPVANGGTGATTAGAALTSLGAAASGANTDITALDQDVTVTATGTIAATSIGYRGIPQNAQSGNYTFALSDAGKHIYSTNSGAQTMTVPTNASVALPIGTAVTLVNNGTTAITFTTTSTTVYKAGTSAAWASGGTLGLRGMVTWLKVGTDTWFVSGAGLS